MKILFIGGTGNISHSCTQLALKAGHEVWLLRRGNTDLRPLPKGVNTIHGDVRNPQFMQSLCAQWKREGTKFDSITDWVCFTSEQARQDVQDFAPFTNQFVFISSASAYQKPSRVSVITEKVPLENPYWQYSRDKIACENIFFAAHTANIMPVTVVRPSHTFDSYIPAAVGDRAFTVPGRILAGQPVILHGDGTTLWTLTHASDFAKGFVGLLGNSAALGEAFHITSDQALTWREIYTTIALVLERDLHVVYIPSETIARLEPAWGDGLLGDKAWCAVFDNSKVRSLVPDFHARLDFKSAITSTLQWFRENPQYMRIDAEVSGRMDNLINRY